MELLDIIYNNGTPSFSIYINPCYANDLLNNDVTNSQYLHVTKSE